MNIYVLSFHSNWPVAVIVQLYPGLRAESRSLRAFKQTHITSIYKYIYYALWKPKADTKSHFIFPILYKVSFHK